MYANQRFYPAVATHSIESPDLFGRPMWEQVPRTQRPSMSVKVRFVRGGAAVSTVEISGDASISEQCWTMPDGVKANLTSQTERSFSEGVVGVGDSQNVVRTTRVTRSSGVQVDGMFSRLPGSLFRADANYTVSSFIGTGTDRAITTIPIQGDFPLHKWVPVYEVRGASASALLSFMGDGLTGSLAFDVVRVYVRAEG